MNLLVNQASILIFAISLNLVWANSSLIDNVSFGDHINLSGESSDASDTCEYFYSFCCEDDGFMCDSKAKTYIFHQRNDLIQVFEISTLNEYLNSVWQPPKF